MSSIYHYARIFAGLFRNEFRNCLSDLLPIECAHGSFNLISGGMRIDAHGHAIVFMAHKLLNDLWVHAFGGKARGESMAQVVEVDALALHVFTVTPPPPTKVL